MSLFNSVLGELGIGSAQAAEKTLETAAAAASPEGAAISEVDFVSKLEGLAASHAEKLNWKTSIVDLLKILVLESSLTVRKELATDALSQSKCGVFRGSPYID